MRARLLSFVLAASSFQFGTAPPHKPQVIAAKEGGYALFEPRFVIGPGIKSFSFSDDGRFVVAFVGKPVLARERLRVKPPEEQEFKFVLWDSLEKTVKDLALPPNVVTSEYQVLWLARSHKVLLSYETFIEGEHFEWRGESLLLDADTGQTKTVLSENRKEGWTRLYFIPNRTAALAMSYAIPTRTYSFRQMNERGRWAASVTAGPRVRFGGDTRFSLDGKSFVTDIWKGKDVLPKEYLVYDLDTNKLSVTTAPGRKFEAASTPQETFLTVESETSLGHDISIDTCWLSAQGSKDRAMVVQHCDSARLSPSGSYVLSVINGVLFSSTVQRLSPDDYAAHQVQEHKEDVMNLARQSALAILMYASDHDDFIKEDFSFQADAGPYFRHDERFKAFVYTFVGGSFVDVTDPQRTEMGHVLSPYGRAVAYADGHVEWKGN